MTREPETLTSVHEEDDDESGGRIEKKQPEDGRQKVGTKGRRHELEKAKKMQIFKIA